MKLLVISLCTQGVMREHFIYYCKRFAKINQLYCITNNNVTNEELEAIETLNISYGRSDPLGYFSLTKLRRMKDFIRRIDPDIVYVFTHHATSILIARFLSKYRLIYQVHDPNPHEGVGLITRIILSTQLKQYSKLADKLVVAGESVKGQVVELCPYAEDKIVPIPFAVLDNYINDSVKPVDKKVDVFFYGRIEPYKGLDLLVDAARLIDKNIHVFIAGGGNIREAYPEIGDLPENVILLGFLDNDTLISYIKASTLIVFPYREASGTMTVCQCCYYGKPLVVSNVGVLPEYAGDSGIVLKNRDPHELADIIASITGNKELQRELSENAKTQYDRHFKIEIAINLHQKLFDNVMSIQK